MTKMQRDEIKKDREAWHDNAQANTKKLYEQVYKGLLHAGHTASASIVKIAVADLLKAYPMKGA